MSNVYGSNFANVSKGEGSATMISNAPEVAKKKQLIATAISEGNKSSSAGTGELVSGAVAGVGGKIADVGKLTKDFVSGAKKVKDAREGTSALGKLMGRSGTAEGTEMDTIGTATADASEVAEASSFATGDALLDATGIGALVGVPLAIAGGIGLWWEHHKGEEDKQKQQQASEKAQAVDLTPKEKTTSSAVETANISASKVGQ